MKEPTSAAGATAASSSAANKMKKSTKCTVFVRLVPTPQQKVMRHELENYFSQVGPIKKSSWISASNADDINSKGYGFVKYTTEEDAKEAAETLDNTNITMNGETLQLKVHLAASAGANSNNHHGAKNDQKKRTEDGNDESGEPDDSFLKKHARVIVRNLSFYAKASHVQSFLQERYGPIVDVHVPMAKPGLHVGFCFVTFKNPKDAKKAVEDEQTIMIKRRAAKIDWSVSKRQHDDKKAQANEQRKLKDDENNNKKKASAEESDDENSENDDSDDSGSSSSEDEDDAKADNDDDSDEKKKKPETNDDALAEKRTLFLRNLPFDASRHDVFKLFAKFGHVQSIYIVKDHGTGMNKGTAFLTYTHATSAQKALDLKGSSHSLAASASGADGGELAATANTTTSSPQLMIENRPIYVSLAVNKETATTFADKDQQKRTTDRRNLYLRVEDRVGDSEGNDSWESLPDKDKQKRQISNREKLTKLKSPLFFINPFRLSFKNLGKQVGESELQSLCVKAIKKALKNGLVTANDQIQHWQASGDKTTRDILDIVQEKETSGEAIIPLFDDTNIKEFIPSVFISRDMAVGLSKKSKDEQPSRGFGFVEFKHHAHALACLRELNNNTAYSFEHVAGGKGPSKRSKKKPGDLTPGNTGPLFSRLIVDFTVENRVKVQKQLERRVAQQVNSKKQQIEHKLKAKQDSAMDVDKETATKEDKKSRGARQRERKRKTPVDAKTDDTSDGDNIKNADNEQTKTRPAQVTDDGGDVESARPPSKKKKNNKKSKGAAAETKTAPAESKDTAIVAEEPKKKSGARWFN